MKKLLVFTPYPNNSADTRYRLSQFVPYMENKGWTVDIKPFMNDRFFEIYNLKGRTFEKIYRTLLGFLTRIIQSFNAIKYDLIIIHKEMFPFGPPLFEMFINWLNKPIIYDMDDAFWTHPPQFRQIGKIFRDPLKIEKIFSISNTVLAGNDYLADYAKNFSKKVVSFPTVLDLDFYKLRSEEDNDIVTIGWVGRWSSQSYLSDLQIVFQNLIKKYPKIDFRFIGVSPDFQIPDIPVKILKWKLEEEITALIPIDIGIMPLPDDEYSRGKCGFKLLQYMALGIPSVASPVGVNSLIIKDGINGFLATSKQEWEEKLSKLIENRSLRIEIGTKARNTVERNYSLQRYAPILLSLLNSIYYQIK